MLEMSSEAATRLSQERGMKDVVEGEEMDGQGFDKPLLRGSARSDSVDDGLDVTPKRLSLENRSTSSYERIDEEDENSSDDLEDGRPPRLAANAPTDVRNLAYIIMFLQGIAMLFPWNAFITAENFYKVVFNGTSFEHSFESFFSISYMGTNLLTYLISFLWIHKVSQRSRIIVPSVITVCALGVATGFCFVDDLDAGKYFAITISLVIVSGACAAILQGAVFALSASLEHEGMYSQAVMSGQGFAGLVCSLASIITSASFPPNSTSGVRASAFLYFLIATIIVVAAVVGILVYERLPFAQHYSRRQKRVQKSYSSKRATQDLTPTTASTATESPAAQRTPRLMSTPGSAATPGSLMTPSSVLTEATVGDDGEPSRIVLLTPGTFQRKWTKSRKRQSSASPMSITSVSLRIMPYIFCVSMVFCVTLALFPGTTVLIKSNSTSKSRFFGDLFIPFNFLIF